LNELGLRLHASQLQGMTYFGIKMEYPKFGDDPVVGAGSGESACPLIKSRQTNFESHFNGLFDF
jgi:hypothetical protein